MIEAKNLTKDYGEFRAADNVSFKVEKGDIPLSGPNGAGKSTTMKMLTGFLTPRKDRFDRGHDIRENPLEAKKLFGYLFESISYQEMTVLEFLTFIAEMRGYHDKEARDAVIKEPRSLS